MKPTALRLTVIGGILLFLFSCLTINIYFPEAAVKKTAEEIVQEVRQTEKEGEKEKKEDFSLVPALYAQQETEVSTPKTRAIKQSLKDRVPKLTSFFDQGNIGEGNNGYVHVRDEASLNLQEKAQLRNLVKDENNDRKNLYAEVASALDIDSSQIERIEKIFAESWIKAANSGWWIQKENGEWAKKQ